MDVSFHSPEWHAARIAALTTERVSWEDFKKKQKDDEKLAATEAAVGQIATCTCCGMLQCAAGSLEQHNQIP